MTRVLRGLGSLALLTAGVLGVPVALLTLSGVPRLTGVRWTSIVNLLLRPDDGHVLVAAVSVVAWLAWLVFTVSVLTELVTLLTRRRVRWRLPGLGGPQRLAGALLLSVAALVATQQLVGPPPASWSGSPTHPSAALESSTSQPVVPGPVASSAAVPEQSVPALAAPTAQVPTADAPTAETGKPASAKVHRVEPGDDLWSLAQHYYGHGSDWRRIAAANPQLLSGGPDRLEPGWRLQIPGVAATSAAEAERTVVVRSGDSLSSIAGRELGSEELWPDLFAANRSQLTDPDELPAGVRLLLPPEHHGAADAKGVRSGEDSHRSTPRLPVESPPSGTVPRGAVPSAPPRAPDSTVAPTMAAQPGLPAPAASEPALPSAASDPAPGPTSEAEPTLEDAGVALPLTGVGGLLAAELLAGLLWRRRVQLRGRRLGRRIRHPDPAVPTVEVEVALGARQRPLSVRTLDRALRAIAAHCRSQQIAPPPLLLAAVADDQIELIMSAPAPRPPVGFTARGRSWLLDRHDAEYLATVPGIGEAMRPWPGLVTLGRDAEGRLVMADLEALGVLRLESGHDFDARSALAALAVELSFSPWSDELILTLVGKAEPLPDALGKHNVTQTSDVEALLTRLEDRARIQRQHHPHPVLGQHRLDPDLADPWAPEILLVSEPLGETQQRRLREVILSEPRVTTAAVVVGPMAGAPWSLTGDLTATSPPRLEPLGLSLRPQQLPQRELDAIVHLVEVTGSEETTAAPWWNGDDVPPDRPPDNVTYLGRRFLGGAGLEMEGGGAVAASIDGSDLAVHHPTLLLIGPVELVGAAGTLPPRAGKQCLEYCGWLLEHPGTTAQAMASALAVAEGTRRSNMSRLRTWLGESPEGEPYLPDAYTGRIRLHPAVSSDWQRLQILSVGGVNRASRDSLEAALQLVRGAPLADAAPGQWHWAEELRTDIVSCLRDVGVELTNRALAARDIDLARWAAARALVAAPGDELLLAARIRTEHLAGNPAETERLTLQLAAQARHLGVDLDPETVTLLQQVMEGRVRARLA